MVQRGAHILSSIQATGTLSILLLVFQFAVAYDEKKSAEIAKDICLLNCAQCAKVFGKYFMAEPCAEYCVSYPFIENKFDCFKLSSVRRYLRRLVVI